MDLLSKKQLNECIKTYRKCLYKEKLENSKVKIGDKDCFFYKPKSFKEIEKNEYVEVIGDPYVTLTFPDGCGMFSGFGVLVDTNTNYVVGISPPPQKDKQIKTEDKKTWFIIGNESKEVKNKLLEKIEAATELKLKSLQVKTELKLKSLQVKSEYNSSENYEKSNKYYDIARKIDNFFKKLRDEGTKVTDSEMTDAFHAFLLMVVESARCSLLGESVAKNIGHKPEMNNPTLMLSQYRIVAGQWNNGQGPKIPPENWKENEKSENTNEYINYINVENAFKAMNPQPQIVEEDLYQDQEQLSSTAQTLKVIVTDEASQQQKQSSVPAETKKIKKQNQDVQKKVQTDEYEQSKEEEKKFKK